MPRERVMISAARARGTGSPPQYLEELLQLQPYLLHDLLTLTHIRACLFACEFLTGAADGEALLVEQAANLPYDDHVLALVITPIAATLHGFQLRKFLLPVAQHMRLHAAQLT